MTKIGGIERFCEINGLQFMPASAMCARDSAIKCAQEYGCVNSKLLKEHYNINEAQLHWFGGIKKLCETYGLRYRMGLRYDPDEILHAAIEYYDKHGEIRQEKFVAECGYSTCAIHSAFGGYNNMLKAAGIPIYLHKKYSESEIIADVKEVFEKYNSSSSTVYRKNGKYSQSIIDRTFGSWENMLDLLDVPHMRRRYGNEKMLEDMRRAYEKYGFLSKSIIANECDFTYEAAIWAFDGVHGIENALGASGVFDRAKSSGQIMLCEMLNKLVGESGYIEEQTFSWLVNPLTGRHLYFDFYLPELQKCIEYQGEQHYKYSTFFHRGDEGRYRSSVRRDIIKKILADSQNMQIVYFTYKETITENLVASRIFS